MPSNSGFFSRREAKASPTVGCLKRHIAAPSFCACWTRLPWRQSSAVMHPPRLLPQAFEGLAFGFLQFDRAFEGTAAHVDER